MAKRITTIRLDEVDEIRIEKIRKEFNYPDGATAIRAAIMLVAADIPEFTSTKESRRKILKGVD